jgi:hypothetical protein
MNDLVVINNNSNDGWGDAAADAGERVTRGTFLKFAEWKWTKGKEGTEVPDGTRLAAVGTAYGWVKWEQRKPVKYVMREPGKKLCEREELGDLNKEDWEAGPDGQPKDCWQATRFVHLMDPFTAELFTFSTSSWGGKDAVMDLGDQITRVRHANPGAIPIVELGAAPYITKFGRKSKPVFKVVEWKKGGSLVEGDEPRPQIEHAGTKSAKAVETATALDDDLPW